VGEQVKIAVVKPGVRSKELLEGEDLDLRWSVDGSEVVVEGKPDFADDDGLLLCALKKTKVAVLMESSELTRLRWRGRVLDVTLGTSGWRRTCSVKIAVEKK
jgi:hypothetical protein